MSKRGKVVVAHVAPDRIYLLSLEPYYSSDGYSISKAVDDGLAESVAFGYDKFYLVKDMQGLQEHFDVVEQPVIRLDDNAVVLAYNQLAEIVLGIARQVATTIDGAYAVYSSSSHASSSESIAIYYEQARDFDEKINTLVMPKPEFTKRLAFYSIDLKMTGFYTETSLNLFKAEVKSSFEQQIEKEL